MRTRRRSVASQTFAVPSWLAVTIREPSGLNDADTTQSACPLRVEELGPARRVPDPRRPVPTRGDDPRPVGAERRRTRRHRCAPEGEDSAPVVASQTLAVRSQLAVTIRDPSGLNAAEPMPPVCPLRVRTRPPSSRPRPSPFRSTIAVTIRDPSGLNDCRNDDQRCAPSRAEELRPPSSRPIPSPFRPCSR